MHEVDDSFSCGGCWFFNGQHACLHPDHIKNVNPWHLCPDWEAEDG